MILRLEIEDAYIREKSRSSGVSGCFRRSRLFFTEFLSFDHIKLLFEIYCVGND